MFCKKHRNTEIIKIPEEMKENLKSLCKNLNYFFIIFFHDYMKCYDGNEYKSEMKMLYLLNNDTNTYDEVEEVIKLSFPTYTDEEIYRLTKLVDDVGYAQFPVLNVFFSYIFI